MGSVEESEVCVSGLYLKRIRQFILFSFSVLFLGLTYYVLVRLGYAINCPFAYFFNMDCLFCGLTRMCMAIIEMRYIEAFYYNQAAFIMLPFIMFLYFKTGITYIKSGRIRNTEFDNRLALLMFISIVIFGIIRNLVGIQIGL